MANTERTFALMLAGLLSGGLAGCDTGSVGEGIDEPDDAPDLICSAELAVTGTRSGPPPDPEEGGCQQLGTWTVDVTLVDAGDCGEVRFEPRYVYEVTGSPDDGFEITYLADPDNELLRLKITGEGPGCSGSFEHWSADATELLLLRPFEENTEITGFAEFERYSQSQF